jgi:3-oxoacyl-[acyl-carrier-protein] synthase-3
MSRPVYLGAVSHRAGTWHGIETLAARPGANQEEIQHLQRTGLVRYSVLERPLRQIYPECVKQTLDRAGLLPAAVDAIVFFTSTFESYQDYDDLAWLSDELGLTNALPMGLFLGQCTNYSNALLVASNLVTTNGLDNVLLLGADVLDEARASRVLGGRLSVFSDAVVSCLVSARDRGGYELGPIRHHYLPHMYKVDPARDILPYINGFSDGLRTACQKLYRALDLQGSAFARLVPANLNLQVLKNYAALAGVPFDRTFTANVGRYGHMFSYDQLISLATLAEEGAVTSGDRLLVVGVGADYLFSALSVTRT